MPPPYDLHQNHIQKPAHGRSPVHTARILPEAARLPAGRRPLDCRFGRGQKGTDHRGHLPAPVRQERAPGAGRDLPAVALLKNRLRDCQSVPHLEAPVDQRHAPPGARPGAQHHRACPVVQRVRLHIQSWARTHFLPVRIAHRKRGRRHSFPAPGMRRGSGYTYHQMG